MARRRGLGAALTIALLLTAGCIGLAEDTAEEDVASQSVDRPSEEDLRSFTRTRIVQDHDHAADVAHETHAGELGIEQAGFAAMRSDGAYPDGEVYMEMAIQGEHAYVVFGPRSGFLNPGDEAGFAIFDVSDPSQPEEVGRWLGQPLGDIEVSDDGDTVFASTQRNGYPYPFTVNPDAGATGHAPRGTYVVDVSDKTAPATETFVPLPTNGPHTITYEQLPDGTELLLQSTYDILFTTYPEDVGQNTATQRVVISEVVREAGTVTLERKSTFQKLVEPEQQAQHFPHDATIHVDPDTGRWIMDVAYWDFGLVTVDISDPSQPEELATFDDTGPSNYTQTHLVRVFPGTIDGKTVGVMEPEIPSGNDDGQFTFVDLSDPADPTKLGYWSLPGNKVVDQPFIFSPHNFELACGGDGQTVSEPDPYGSPCEDPTVVASHFHAGLWVLDASDPTDPSAQAFAFPNVTRSNVGEGFPFTGFATVFVQDGTVYAPEIWTGLHVYEGALDATDVAD